MPNKSTRKEELNASNKLLADKNNQQTQALQSGEAQLRTLIDSLPFDVFLLGRGGRHTLQNASCRKNWGDIIGKRPEDVCDDPKTLALWKSNNARAFAGETVEADVRFKVKGEEKHYHNIISPVSENKEITGVLGINIDITELRQMERRLRAEEELTETALDTQKDTFFIFDPKNGQAIRWNKPFNQVAEYSDDEIRSMKAPDSYYSRDDLQKARAAIEHLDRNDTVVVGMSLITKSGKTTPTEYIGSVLRDEKENLQYIIAIGLYITKHKWAEEKLAQAEERYRKVADFTYNLEVYNFYDSVAWKT